MHLGVYLFALIIQRPQALHSTEIQPLVVGNSPSPGFVAQFTDQFVAEEKGFYEEDIEVEERHFQVSTEINAALAASQMISL